jgi:hypothetical protein
VSAEGLRCYCEACAGRTWTDIGEFRDAHPHDAEFMLVETVDEGRPYQASPKNVQQMFDWDEPL